MLTVKNIVKTYVTGGLIQDALKNVSLSFRKSEFVSILGHSGSGKTTLLNIIGGLDQYTSGDLYIDGVSTKKYKSKDWDAYRNHSIGFIFQSYNLISHQTVLRNVELALTISGVKRKERKKRAKEALIKVGLGDHINKKPNQLSGGQMQRVAIARALINDPKIILADEPTGALDSDTSEQVMDILKEIAKDRLVIMVTHNPDLAKEYSTRIIQLKDGEIISDNNPYNEEIVEKKVKRQRNKSMSFFTAFLLSLNNLLTKKSRTIMTSFAGSIGIIGIALILSVSTGFQEYIDKIQEDTLSTYPFTITTETANLTEMMISMTQQDEDEEKDSNGKIVENQVLNDMFAHIDANNVKAFKEYYETQASDEIKNGIVTVKYSYDVAPKIYSKSFKYGVTRVHPTSMFADAYSYMSISFTNMDSVFQEMTTNYEQYEENYDVVAGKWPAKYNECVLVLLNKDSISDFTLYQLGLRDPDELEELLTNVMSGKTTEINNNQYTYSYEDFLNMIYAIVPSSSLYKYNTQYDIYEDMSDDEEYMKDVINNAEELKIVGIVVPKEDSTATTLNPGIAYRKELINHIIDISKNSDIVKRQLKNKNIDVFSNSKFNTDKKEGESSFDFKDLITVDEDMIKNAFKVNISEKDFLSEDDLKTLILNTTTSVGNNINSINATTFGTLIAGIDSQIINGAIDTYVSNNTSVDGLNVDFSDTQVNGYNYFDTAEYRTLANSMATTYAVVDEATIRNMSQSMVTSAMSSYVTQARTFGSAPYSTITKANVDTINKTNIINSILAQPINTQKVQTDTISLIKKVSIGYAAQGIGTAVAESMKPLKKMFEKDIITFDNDKFANAFKFNSDEDEMQRIINAYMNGSENATLEDNLSKLDYAELDTPKTISFYFRDFDSKENFIKFLDDYNDDLQKQGNENDVIKYTDITGILMNSVKTIVDAVSYTLIAFVAISLVVSSIMIGVITLISVMERTKEIGILRAIGASKKDVSRVFNVETFIVGLFAGLLGVGISYLSLIPINNLLHNITGIKILNAILPITSAIILVGISIFLTLLAGIIPSRSASKKNPVEALRTE